MDVSGARDLPDLRMEMLDRWRPGGPLRAAAQVINPIGAQRSGLDRTFATIEGVFDERALEDASLWWVTADMAKLIEAAAPSLPPTTLTPELMPAKSGLVVFEEPLTGQSANPDEPPVTVDALLWGDSETLKIRISRRPYIGIAVYRKFSVDGITEWLPLGRTDWHYGDDTEEPVDPKLIGHDQRLASMAEDRRWMACLWLLASQRRVSEHSKVFLPRYIVRRSQRAGLGADVKLLDVRRSVTTSEDGDHDPQHVEWSHRWLVRPHWRQQAYGPGRTLRRPVFVPPHVKGPADKPLVVKPSVNVIRD